VRHLHKRRSPGLTWAVGLVGAALLLTACGDADDTDDGEDVVEDVDEDADEDAAAEDDGEITGQGDTISIGWMPWEEAIAVTNLWHAILEENGFEVDQQQLDPGLVFEGVSTGDLDLFLDAWLPNTHEQYWDQYSEDVEDFGQWLDDAPLTWTVPAYVDEVDSIADLADNADLFDGTIVGIEPGAGLTNISQNEVIPTYGLEDSFELLESSTPAMLAELDAAYENEEPILVTLWRPHPAYAEYDLKDLEDPENALGDPDSIHAIGRDGFSDDYPELAEAFQNFQFEHDALSELEVQVLEEEGQELENARAWLEDNTDIVNEWLEGTGLQV
jgi:glycine betaine/proline transport system substrate-binding protein